VKQVTSEIKNEMKHPFSYSSVYPRANRNSNNSTPINILLLQKPGTAGLGDGEAIRFHDLEDFDSQSKLWTEP
jgi:hypothetical protein